MLHFPARSDMIDTADVASDAIDSTRHSFAFHVSDTCRGSHAPTSSTDAFDAESENCSTPSGRDSFNEGWVPGSQNEDRQEDWADDEEHDDLDDDEAPEAMSLPKLSDADFASAFQKARASSWVVRKQLALDGGIQA